MKLIGVESVIYGVADMSLGKQFWLDFGLVLEKDTPDHLVFRTEENTTIELKPLDAPDLPSGVAEGSTACEIVWAAETQNTLDQIAEELSKDRDVRKDESGTIHSIDPLGIGIAFRTTQRKKLIPRIFCRMGSPFRYYKVSRNAKSD